MLCSYQGLEALSFWWKLKEIQDVDSDSYRDTTRLKRKRWLGFCVPLKIHRKHSKSEIGSDVSWIRLVFCWLSKTWWASTRPALNSLPAQPWLSNLPLTLTSRSMCLSPACGRPQPQALGGHSGVILHLTLPSSMQVGFLPSGPLVIAATEHPQLICISRCSSHCNCFTRTAKGKVNNVKCWVIQVLWPHGEQRKLIWAAKKHNKEYQKTESQKKHGTKNHQKK